MGKDSNTCIECYRKTYQSIKNNYPPTTRQDTVFFTALKKQMKELRKEFYKKKIRDVSP